MRLAEALIGLRKGGGVFCPFGTGVFGDCSLEVGGVDLGKAAKRPDDVLERSARLGRTELPLLHTIMGSLEEDVVVEVAPQEQVEAGGQLVPGHVVNRICS